MTSLFEYPDTQWVPKAREFFEARLPHGELWKDAVDVSVSIVNMQKAVDDAFGKRENGMSVYMLMLDMFRVLPYNKMWRVFSGEISARFSNGISRAKEGADMQAAGFKPTDTMDDAAFMEHKFAWMDTLVFIGETLGVDDLPSYRSDLRKLLYGL